ncbi:MAG: hypothetical protein R3F59_19140 [Myxococcota bacterium]
MTNWNRTMVVAACLFAVACGYSEKKFKDDYLSSYCAANVECADAGTGIFFTDASECEAFLGAFFGLGNLGCDYDPASAKDCVADLDAADCSELNSLSSCNAVYSGDTCGWGGSTGTTPTSSTTSM